MNVNKLTSVDELEQFLAGTQAVAFNVEEETQPLYQWIQATLSKFRYNELGKPKKGILMQYLIKITGYSRSSKVAA